CRCRARAPRGARPPAAAAPIRDATPVASWKPLSLFHFTLSVSSIERSIEFYTAIGFQLLRDNRDVIWPDYVAPQFGLARAQGRGALLAIGDGGRHTQREP